MKKRKDSGQEQLLKEITKLLSNAHIPYMVTGSLSVIFYGRPRASHDIDFVIEAQQKDIKRIKEAFSSLPYNEFIIDHFLIEDAIKNKKQFNVLHLPTMLKLDFWILRDNMFDQERFKRKKDVYLFKQKMIFSSAEDTILKKLLWYQKSKIEKHLIDAAFVYQIQKDNLDKNYLALWAKKLKVEKLLNEIKKINLENHY